MHGKGNYKCYQPHKDDDDVGMIRLAIAVADGSIKGMESVNADTNEAVDGC